MENSRWIPIEEAVASIESDPNVRKLRQEIQARRAIKLDDIARQSEPILNELSKSDINIESIDQLFHRRPVSNEVVVVLLRWLKPEFDDELLETICSNLQHAKKKFDGRPLAFLFENAKSHAVRFDAGYTISKTLPVGLEDWLTSALSNPEFGDARFTLVRAVAKLAPRHHAIRTLRECFEQSPQDVSAGLGLIGEKAELEFLLEQQHVASHEAQKHILKAIKLIEKRTP